MAKEIAILGLVAIPLLAVFGGITIGIIRTISRQRSFELAQKERIAAIERGVDLEKLKPLTFPSDRHNGKTNLTFEQRQLRRSHGILVAGLVMTAFGLSLSVMLQSMEPEPGAWAAGMLFAMPGFALIIASRVGRPSVEEVRRSVEEHPES